MTHNPRTDKELSKKDWMMTDHAKLEAAARALVAAVDDTGRNTLTELAVLRAALEAEPMQEVTGYVHPSTGRFVCDESQSSENKFTQDSAPGDASEEAMEIRDQIDHGCDGIAANAADVIATALTKAHAAGRAEMVAEVRGVLTAAAQDAYDESRRHPVRSDKRVGNHVASCRIRELLAKLPEAGQ